MLTVRVCWHDTLELITLFVNRVFRISALWFISQIHEKASLVKANIRTRIRHKQSKYIHFIHLMGKGRVYVFVSLPVHIGPQRTKIGAEQFRNHVYPLRDKKLNTLLKIKHDQMISIKYK